MPEQENLPQKQGTPVGERAALEGWASVENEMLKHDEGTMKGYIGDVDTLLVFAGLFSAVLTAFVVESYQRLQLDTGQGSMMVLRRISVQLESFTLSPGFLNSSSTAPSLPSLDFVADTSTRWVNILWFLGLVFSLAAALFGILVKQWIREYMQWNFALAIPRENVLVRQIRFESWNSWHVPATIAIIPALLEIALVFFVCGLVILLWTLDPVVSIVITTSVAVFLAIASTFTILPAFFERCPYKSPTAWACAVAWDFIRLWIPHTISRIQYRLGEKLHKRWDRRAGLLRTFGKWLKKNSGLDNWQLGEWAAISSNWRARDLADVWTSLSPKSSLKRGEATVLLDELLSEKSCEDSRHECTQKKAVILADTALVERDEAKMPLHDALRTITELPPLIRALSWVSQASQDTRIQHSVLDCVESLESRFVLPQSRIWTNQGRALTQEGVRAVSTWHLLVSFGCRSDLTLDRAEEAPERENKKLLKSVTIFRTTNAGRLTCPRVCTHYGESSRHHEQTSYSVDWDNLLRPTDHSQLAVSMLVLLSSISVRKIVERLVKSISYPADYGTIRGARRVMELLAMICSVEGIDFWGPCVTRATNYLVDVLRLTNGDTRQPFESRFPELRGSICMAARGLGTYWTSALEDELFGPFQNTLDPAPATNHDHAESHGLLNGTEERLMEPGPSPRNERSHQAQETPRELVEKITLSPPTFLPASLLPDVSLEHAGNATEIRDEGALCVHPV